MRYLNKVSMDEIAGTPSRKRELGLIVLSDAEQQQLLTDTIKKYDEHWAGRKKCPACKENFEKGEGVCEAHYHDYMLCDEDWCLPCLLQRSGRAAYPNDPKWWD